MKKVLLLLSVFLAFSCSKEEVQNQESSEELKVANFERTLIPTECSGYGIYDNEEYDCGWKIGYDDWVAHYNYVVNGGNYPECYNIRVATYIYNSETHVTIEWQTVDNSMAIIQEAQNNNWPYYNNLYNISYPTDRDKGQQDGYAAGRGQQPYAANDSGSCY